MWLLKGNAAGLFGEDRRGVKSASTRANGDAATGDGKGRGKERRRRREVDLIMEEILRVV
jgi:hypothetical protein